MINKDSKVTIYRVDDGEWLDFDATISEQYSPEVQVSEHELEDGTTINDHARSLPERFTIRAMITESPLGTAPVTGPERVQAAIAFLKRCERRLLYVGLTRTGAADSVMLLGYPYTIDGNRSVTFDLSFRKVRFARSTTITFPRPVPRVEPTVAAPVDAGVQVCGEPLVETVNRAEELAIVQDLGDTFGISE